MKRPAELEGCFPRLEPAEDCNLRNRGRPLLFYFVRSLARKMGAFRSLLSSNCLTNFFAAYPGSSLPACPLYHLISLQSLCVSFLIRDNFPANLACCSRFSLTLIASGFISDISHVISPHFLEDYQKNSSERSSRPFRCPFHPVQSLPPVAGCAGRWCLCSCPRAPSNPASFCPGAVAIS